MSLPPMDRRFARACVVGALLAGVVFTWVILAGRADLTPTRPAADFYDAQARALFDGQWDLPPEVLSIEAFEVDGRSYTYFGPVPSLLRMPVLLVTDDLDGRLTVLSMLAAFAVTMLGTSRLAWRVRSLVRGPVRVRRREAVITALFVFGVGAGSVVLYLASQAVVYHEAILWGIAWSLLAYHAIVGLLVAPGRRPLAWACLFTTLAFLTRASVGLGPVVALGLGVAVIVVARWWPGAPDAVPRAVRVAMPGLARRPSGRLVVAAVLAVLVPVGAYVGVNLAKFGEVYRLPLEKQVFSDLDPARQAALDDNGGSLFGLRFVPTTAWQAIRPDAVDVSGAAPWLTFPRSEPDVIGDATFDTLDESSSLTATMPLLVVLGVIGLVVVVRGRPSVPVDERSDLPEEEEGAGPPAVAAARLPVVGATVGFATTLTIAFVAHRYLGDALPALLLLALVGLHACGHRFGGLDAGSDSRPELAAVVVGAGFLLLGVWGVATNLALAVEYQRLVAPVDLADRAAFVGFQLDAPGDPPVRRAVEVPAVADRGTLLVVGECEALLWSDGHAWYVLEGGVPPTRVGDDVPVVTEGRRDGASLCARLE